MNVLSLHMNAMPQTALGVEWVKLCGWGSLPPLEHKDEDDDHRQRGQRGQEQQLPRLEMEENLEGGGGGHRDLVERIRREVRNL